MFEEGGRSNALIEVLCMDVEDVDVLVEEQQGQQLLVHGDGHSHNLAVVRHV